MRIPRRLLDEYTRRLNALSEKGQELVINALENARWGSIAELREIMSNAMDQVCSWATDDATVLASEMYDDIRELALGKRLGVIAPDSYDPDATNGAVRALVGSVDRTGSTARFGRQLAERVDYEVKRAAGNAVIRQSRRDPAKPRYARVPTGVETCSFCIMLASRGFVYHSENSAGSDGHYHAHCDCRIVQGYDGMEVEGYDPIALYRVWKRLDSAEVIAKDFSKGGRANVIKEVEELNERSIIAWRQFKESSQTSASYQNTYGSFVRSLSPAGLISIEDFTKPEAKELQVAIWLSRTGKRVELRNADLAFIRNDKTSDMYIDGIRYEAKRIVSSNPKKIGTRINEKLDRQGPRYVIDLSVSSMDMQKAEAKIAWLLEDPRIEEIILVRSNVMKRFRK